MEQSAIKKRYDNLNGLRSIAAICIVLMHVLGNGMYDLSGEIFNVIRTFGGFVSLFFMMSGFSICCGYYERIKNNEISMNEFYSNRYKRILPYFSLLVLADMLASWNGIGQLIEAFTQLSLWGGFLPYGTITVIGVGWTLGVTFAFYMLFPFVVFLLWNKKRAWCALALTIALSYICVYYFKTNDNFVRFFFYFIAGGILYLYRDTIQRWLSNKRWLMRALACLAAIGWCVVPRTVTVSFGAWSFELAVAMIIRLLIFSVWILYAMGEKERLLDNAVTKFISGISMEIYLAHMAIFRIVEKIGLTQVSDNPLVSYLVAFALTLGGVIIFAAAYQFVAFYIQAKYFSKEKGIAS